MASVPADTAKMSVYSGHGLQVLFREKLAAAAPDVFGHFTLYMTSVQPEKVLGVHV